MPYILLVIGLIVGGYALYRFLLKANWKQIGILTLFLAIMVVLGSIVFLAMTGRLPMAIGAVAALYPLVMAVYKQRKKAKEEKLNSPNPSTNTDTMSVEEALNVLGLEENADKEKIKDAHKRLMKKVHPDQEGSDWLAQKINTAKDILLKNKD